jgi:hypothetical protein
MENMENFTEEILKLEPRAYIGLAGNISSIVSTVLFVVFLRQVSRCFEDAPRMRLAEFYLGFLAIVFAGTVFLIIRLISVLSDVPLPFAKGPQFVIPPSVMRELNTLPVAGMLIGIAWLVAVLWYFGLIFSTSKGIQQGLIIRQIALRMANEGR